MQYLNTSKVLDSARIPKISSGGEVVRGGVIVCNVLRTPELQENGRRGRSRGGISGLRTVKS